MGSALRIAINAQFEPGVVGGIQTAVTELVGALGRLGESEDSPEEYVVVGPRRDPGWLTPYLKGPQRLVSGAAASPLDTVRRLIGVRPHWTVAPGGAAFFDGLGCDVVHFPYQAFAACDLPTVYNPHDLQHLHLPHFFTKRELAVREATYGQACRRSETVVVATHFVERDVRERYGVPAEKVQVIPWAAPQDDGNGVPPEALERAKRTYGRTGPFALYPAATWEHKNHLRLLEAVRVLRDRDGLAIEIVCTGQHVSHFAEIEAARAALGLEELVHFPGRVSALDLRALYRTARFVVLPTLFEAASAPLYEAWRDDVPVACSHVTSLPEQAGGAALLFDPYSVEEIAAALRRMHLDETLRESLVARGRQRLGDFSWDRTARAYRAVYRQAAGRSLAAEDEDLLESMRATDGS